MRGHATILQTENELINIINIPKIKVGTHMLRIIISVMGCRCGLENTRIKVCLEHCGDYDKCASAHACTVYIPPTHTHHAHTHMHDPDQME